MRAILSAILALAVPLLACGSDDSSETGSSSGPSTACKARKSEAGEGRLEGGCFCGKSAETSGEPFFPAKCRAASVGARAFCCKDTLDCACRPITCGLSSVASADRCVCGISPIIRGEAFDSCTWKAKTCCMAATYCYCDNRAHCKFESVPVATCDMANAAPKCESFEKQVDACE